MNKKKNDPKDMVFRAGGVEIVTRGEGEEAVKTVRLSVSSEEPYRRTMMWDAKNEKWIDGLEILGHKEGEIDFTRMKDGLVIQDTHWGDQIGLMRNPEVVDGKLCGDVEFCHSERAQDIMKDALAGLRKNMSVGYRVFEYAEVGKTEDGVKIYRAVKWMPHEASFVNVPADTTVGVGRSLDGDGNDIGGAPAVVKKENKSMNPEQVVECFRLAKAGNVEHGEVDALIKSGKTFDEIRAELTAKVETHIKELEAKKPELPAAAKVETHIKELEAKKPELPAAAKGAQVIDDATRTEIGKKYNLGNVLRALAGASVDIGYEREISKEMEAKTGRKAQGIIIPDFVKAAGSETLGRPVTGSLTGVGGSGKFTIAENLLAGNFIDALRDALVLTGAGMQTLTGLVGNIAIPKGGKVTGSWISQEFGDASKTNPTFGQVTATPHTCGAYVDITRQLMLQSSIDVQAFCVKELVYALAHCLEDAAFAGAGTGGAPKGLFSQITQGVSFTAGAPTKAKVLEMITKIDEANGNLGTMKFIGRPSVWAAFGGTLDYTTITGTGGAVGGVTSGKYLLDTANNTMEGYEFIKSNIVPAKSVLFGDWSQLMMCLWSGTDIVVDPYSNCTKGALRVVALQDADFIVRNTEAFAKGTTVIA